jgi:hypothetical protein
MRSKVTHVGPQREDGLSKTASDAAISVLERIRSAEENAAAAAILREHDALRSIKVEVLEYEEARAAQGVPEDQVRREGAELHKTLLRDHVERQQLEVKRELEQAKEKTAERFARAFQTARELREGDSFSRALRQERAAEAERRQNAQQGIQRVKKQRTEP